MFLSKRTKADFQEWRDERDWTERKYALWDAGKRLEPPRIASKGTAREQAMKLVSENPRVQGSAQLWHRVRDPWAQDHQVK